MTHFELIFVCGVKQESNFILLQVLLFQFSFFLEKFVKVIFIFVSFELDITDVEKLKYLKLYLLTHLDLVYLND